MVSMNEAITYRISQLCAEKKMSLTKLSNFSRVPQSTLNEIVQGRSKNPTIETLNKIANGFGMTLAEFFTDDVFQKVIEEEPTPLKQTRKYEFKNYTPNYLKKNIEIKKNNEN